MQAIEPSISEKAHTIPTGKRLLWRRTPYMITDLSIVRKNAETFKRLLPDVSLYYAVKANNDPEVIRVLKPLVAGFDIASAGEMNQLLKLGVKPANIFYSNPVKIPAHIREAYEKGVRYFAFDSLGEIKKLAKDAPKSNVYLRLKVSDYGSKFPLSTKFGVEGMHVVDLCTMAEDFGLKVKGVTFHVGSQSENVQAWTTALEIAGKAIKTLRKKDIKIEFLDLGGGYPADYGELAPGFEEVAETIRLGCAKFLPKDIKLVAEPGRFMVANSSHIVTSIIGRENRSGSDWLYLDIGTFQGLIEPLEMPSLRYPITTDKHPSGYKKGFVLSGPTCDACDTLGSNYLLPSDLDIGDRITIGATGAYSLVYASRFNGFEPPKIYYAKEDEL